MSNDVPIPGLVAAENTQLCDLAESFKSCSLLFLYDCQFGLAMEPLLLHA
jgi:hypothetical protein